MSLINLQGQRFGRLLIGAKTRLDKATAYVCTCDCGKTCVVRSQSLRRNETKSCGCARAERMRRAKTTHGFYKTATYNSHRSMLARCLDRTHRQFKDYGGRGITICRRWQISFAAFLDDMGPRPSGTTLDRINNNGNYEPANCRWATRLQQNRNKRTTKK